MPGEPLRVLIVDDHPAVRAGLEAALDAHQSFVTLGAVTGARDLWPSFHATSPDVVVLDYHLPESDGFSVCRKLKAQVPAPRVVIYSAYADSKLTVPAVLAGADALVNKGVPANELFSTLSRAADGESMLPPLRSEDVDAALARLDPQDAAVISRVLEGDAPPDAAPVVERALERLRLDAPTPVSAT